MGNRQFGGLSKALSTVTNPDVSARGKLKDLAGKLISFT